MGHRLEIYLKPEFANDVLNIISSFDIDAQIIGRVEDSTKNEVHLTSEFGSFTYQ
ncbi:MAG: phosphoribosylformylglycinamidine cyclo-ligase, partial [Bacteroidota bacterium]